MLGTLREDIASVIERDPSVHSAADVIFWHTGMHAVWAYRRAHWLWEHGAHTLASLVSRHTRKRYGVEIHPAAQIGRRFMIDHGMGVVIGETSIIGDDCLIYQGVTLGMTGKHGGKRHPTLGNNVMVGAGTIVLGDIYVGDNVKVAAGSVVVHDVPAGTTWPATPPTWCARTAAPCFAWLSSPESLPTSTRTSAGPAPCNPHLTGARPNKQGPG